MSKKRSQAKIALEQFLKNERLGIRPTRQGEKRSLLDELLIKTDGNLDLENIVRFPVAKKKRNK